MGLLASMVVSAAALSVSSPAPRVSLQWAAPPECIAQGELERRVEARLGERVFQNVEPVSLRIRLQASRGPRGLGWIVRLSAASPEGAPLGVRELHVDGVDCRRADDDVTLVMALMIDPNAVNPVLPPEQARPTAPPDRLEVTTPAVAVAPPPEPWDAALVVAGEGAVGIEPGVAGAVQLSVQAEPPRLPRFEMGADLWSREGASASGGGSGTLTIASGGLRVCPTFWRTPHTEWRACGGVEAGAYWGRGAGFSANASVTEPLVDLTAEARAAVHFGSRWFVEAGAGVWVPLARPQFAYRDPSGVTQPLYQPSVAAAAVRIGAGFTFGNNSRPPTATH
jgi:hypothetical protein